MRVDRTFLFLKAWALGLTSILLLSSCAGGERPFLMVQLCAANDSGVDLFKQTLQSIARDERMRYIDASKATVRDLKAIGAVGKNMHTDGKLVFVGVEGDMGPSLSAGNIGLNAHDIVVGFARGQDNAAADAFSDRVVARLKQHWTLKIVPEGSGAFPNPECAN
jgi:hypothetical protein